LRPGQLVQNGPRSPERGCAKVRAGARAQSTRARAPCRCGPKRRASAAPATATLWSSTSRSASFRASRTSGRPPERFLSTHLPRVTTNNQRATVLSRRRPGDSIDGGQMSRSSRLRNGRRRYLSMASRCRRTRTLDHRKKALCHERQLDLGRTARFAKPKKTPLNTD
jgi:hypothetical protein